MSRTPSNVAPTPVPSSPPPPSESYLSELDETAPSLLDGGGTDGGYAWDERKAEAGGQELNLVSWKLGVNAKGEDGVEKRGFNAISTVLNHPTKKANPLRPSRKPLPPIAPPPTLPKPPPPAFYDSYLRTITPLYEGFIAAQASSSGSSSSASPEASTSAQKLGDFDTRPDERKADLPDLGAVPELWFDEDFDLANPSTWAEIVGDGDSEGDREDLGQATQDELSSHLDALERHLIHEIGLRSTSFFSALSNLQDLHSESSSCLSRIAELQNSLKDVGSKQARKGLEIIDAQIGLRSLRITEAGIQGVGELEELLGIARGMVESGDWAGGLGCLGDVVRWWERNGQQPHEDTSDTNEYGYPHLPLATLPAFASLPSAIASLTRTIASQLEAALAALLAALLARAGSDKPYNEHDFKLSAEPILSGLVRCGKADGVDTIWREAVTTSIREGSRKHLPVASAEEDEEDGKPPEMRGVNLAQALKSMDHSRFLLLSTEMYATILGRLQLVRTVGDDLAKTLEEVSGQPVLKLSTLSSDSATTIGETQEPPPVPALDLTDVLASACELANARAAKILAVRGEQHAGLPITDFVELFKENWEFVKATEGLAQRMIVSLRGVAANQARTFLIAYHGARLTKSAKLVEEEQWTQIDVPASTQHTVDMLIKSAVEDPPECQIPMPANANGIGNGNGNGVGSELAKTLSVEEKNFFVVKATSETLKLLADYLTIVVNLELVVMDVMSRIIEFLKSFNSRTCQVVLGAGAMRSAGLKNITAKHLALASQSLSVIVALIPYIREFIRRHLNSKQAVMLTEFDKLKRDYQEHQNEIHAKLVAIMSDRLSVHVGSLREIDWEASQERESQTPHGYAEMLVKETATLHKVLSKYLALATVETVMSEVLAAIVHRLTEEYTKSELKSEDAKKRMLLDVTLISSRLAPLAEAGKTVASLQTLVKDKPTPRRNVSQTMAGLLRRSASGTAKGDGKKKEGEGDAGEAKDGDGAEMGDEAEDDIGMDGGLTEEPRAMTEEGGGSAQNVDTAEAAPASSSEEPGASGPAGGTTQTDVAEEITAEHPSVTIPNGSESTNGVATTSASAPDVESGTADDEPDQRQDAPPAPAKDEGAELPKPPPVEKNGSDLAEGALAGTQGDSDHRMDSVPNETSAIEVENPPQLPEKA